MRHLIYSCINNVARRVCLDIDMPQGTVDPAAVNITIDAGPMAAELHHLGLPRPPDFCTWGEGLSSRLFAPSPSDPVPASRQTVGGRRAARRVRPWRSDLDSWLGSMDRLAGIVLLA
jgi:hypothetical protein